MFYSVKDLNVFRNKTVIVTGNTGFKGSWLSLWLKLLGAKVIGISFEDSNLSFTYRLLLQFSIYIIIVNTLHRTIKNKIK